MLLSPFVLQFAYLLVLLFIPRKNAIYDGVFDIVNIAFYTFIFGYFGLLSSRLLAEPAEKDSAAAVPGETA